LIASPRLNWTAVRAFAAAGLAAGAMIAAQTAPALAFVQGGCKGTASDVNGHAPGINLVSATEWHVSKDSNLTGSGDAPSDQTAGFAYAMAFGLRFTFIPIAGGTGHGTHGSGSLDVSKVAPYTRVIYATGASTGKDAHCEGYLSVIIDDETALDTAAGKAGVGAGAVGALGLGAVALRKRKGRHAR
jgi:hypothetical protein